MTSYSKGCALQSAPAHAQKKLCHHLRRNLVGDQRRLTDATWPGIREKLKDAAVSLRMIALNNRSVRFVAAHDLARWTVIGRWAHERSLRSITRIALGGVRS